MAARKRKTNYPFAGRPPKDPENKVGSPVRCLVTDRVATAVIAASKLHGIPQPPSHIGNVPSDILRLYIYRGLDHDGLLNNPDIINDPTWVSLREKGLV